MTDQSETAPQPAPRTGPTFASVCLILLVGCCLCASLAASLI
jgi:hypothetical protein